MAYTPGKGTTIATSTGTFAQVTSITPPNMTNDIIDVTHLTSDWHEKLKAIPDGGEINFGLEWHSQQATHVSLLTIFTTSANRTYTITLSEPTGALPTIALTGLMVGLEFGDLAMDNVHTANVTVAATGSVTVTS